ncbi:MAG: hypothetical protein H6556_02975 [Lewinellaceae bacterium]|nr:hypothetical protein [Lewinellaceae bacterium]
MFRRARDCGTGNGQVGVVLAEKADEVQTTCLSARQIQNATARPNAIAYCRIR